MRHTSWNMTWVELKQLPFFWAHVRWNHPNIQMCFSADQHTILKVNFLSKNSISTKPQNFHEFFTQFFFWQFFSWNQSCQQLKSPKPQHFHEFFHPKKSTIFSGNQSWIFGQKMKISNSVTSRGKNGWKFQIWYAQHAMYVELLENVSF